MTSHNTTKQTNYFQYKHLTKPSLFYGVRKRENPYPFFPIHTYVYICVTINLILLPYPQQKYIEILQKTTKIVIEIKDYRQSTKYIYSFLIFSCCFVLILQNDRYIIIIMSAGKIQTYVEKIFLCDTNRKVKNPKILIEFSLLFCFRFLVPFVCIYICIFIYIDLTIPKRG